VKKTKLSPRQEAKNIRLWAITLAILMLTIFSYRYWVHGLWSWPYISIGMLLLPIGILCPPLLALPYRGWSAVAHQIQRVVSTLIMAVMFFGILTPLAIFLRLLGRDMLGVKRQPSLGSYWVAPFSRERVTLASLRKPY
jgi:hypothetical protein